MPTPETVEERLDVLVVGAGFDETSQCWLATTDTGWHFRARFLVMAAGPLSTPKVPPFEGLETFAGRRLHTSDWPHEPIDFTGQRVGVIGTGSSGVQVISELARQARELIVFQRTPAYVVPAHNGPLDPEWEAQVKGDYAGFRKRNLQAFGGAFSDYPPHMVSALAVSDEERRARFEERWQIGGFVFSSHIRRYVRRACKRAGGRVRAQQNPSDRTRPRHRAAPVTHV